MCCCVYWFCHPHFFLSQGQTGPRQSHKTYTSAVTFRSDSEDFNDHRALPPISHRPAYSDDDAPTSLYSPSISGSENLQDLQVSKNFSDNKTLSPKNQSPIDKNSVAPSLLFQGSHYVAKICRWHRATLQNYKVTWLRFWPMRKRNQPP